LKEEKKALERKLADQKATLGGETGRQKDQDRDTFLEVQ
jgi:hypothetical protein